MRGRQDPQVSMLRFVDLETRVPLDHPLRTVKYWADGALARLSPLFDALYAEEGRPSIPPERLLEVSLLMSLYSVRSERAGARLELVLGDAGLRPDEGARGTFARAGWPRCS